MDFDLSEEQRLLRDSIAQLLADHYSFRQREYARAGSRGWSKSLWRQFAQLGLLGLPFSEDEGGSGGSPVETMIVMEAFGRSLVLEPYLSTVLLAGGILRRVASTAQRSALLPQLMSGERLFAFAYAEPASRHDPAAVATLARKDGDGYRIDGVKSPVLHGDSADMLLVLARTRGNAGDRDGLGVFLVPADATGITRRSVTMQDGHRGAGIVLQGVRVGADTCLGDPEAAIDPVERVMEEVIAALCAEAVGAMEEAVRLTTDYLKTRRQFDRPLGSFQALQHRAADMVIALEQARSMAMLAAMVAGDPPSAQRSKAISAAKVQIGRSGRFVGQQAVQLHGGLGMSMEHPVGHYLKRLIAIDLTFGDADHHLARLARLGSLLE